jgi:hypothetical protein
VAERLTQIVVGPKLQAEDTIKLIAPRCQDDNRDVTGLTERAAEIKAVDPGEHQVKQDEVSRRGFKRRPQLITVTRAAGTKAILAQCSHEQYGVEGPTARKRTVAYFTRYRSLPEAGINGGQNYRLVLCSC